MSTTLETSTSPAPPYIPDTAPFTPAQRAWLNGFLAGLLAPLTAPPGMGGAPQPPLPAASPITLTILYGTQTGTASSVSKGFAKEAVKRGFAAKAIDMANFKASQFAGLTHLLIITSTYGDGEPPDSAKALHAEIHSADAPRLAGMQFSVLGLGDTNYEKFCKCAIDFDIRLEQLGATRMHARTDCDLDYETPSAGWLEGVLAACKGTAPALPSTSVADSTAPEVKPWGKSNPYPARLVDNRVLNLPGSAKETRHIAFSLGDSGLTYEPGDALGVIPANCTDLVESILRITGFDGEEAVTTPTGEKPLRLALQRDFDITTLHRGALEKFTKLRGVAELEALLDPTRAGDLSSYIRAHHWLDLLTAYPILGSKPTDFIALLRKLQPRLYSIASSQKAHPDEVHLCVGIVRYELAGQFRKGVCSTYMAERVDGAAPVFFHHNPNFRLPSDTDRGVIMVGPGTGIAPFRAFLEERMAVGGGGKNWLFFGDQRAATDFLYRDELESMRQKGILHRLDLAFSRDQAEKIYVQNRMAEQGAELWKWIDGGAHFYVCGDASRMAKDVETELLKIVEIYGGVSADDAKAYLASLKAQKRYQRDVY